MDFDVGLSFAGEDREYVEEVASILRKMEIRVFYDKYEEVSLWGKDLYTHLREIYFERVEYVVMFLSSNFKDKLWTNHERESAQARAFTEKKEYILPARFDETQIPGILPTIGYIDLNNYSPAEFAEIIKQKIGPIQRQQFFPDEPDKLYDYFECEDDLFEEEIFSIAYLFFKMLLLMTPEERNVLAVACEYCCPAGVPDNVHINLEYLSRLTNIPTEELLSIFSRIDCLSFKSKVYDTHDHEEPNLLVTSNKIIEFSFLHGSIIDTDNGTYVLIGIFDILRNNLCPNCRANAINNVDLSILSSFAGFPEVHQEP